MTFVRILAEDRELILFGKPVLLIGRVPLALLAQRLGDAEMGVGAVAHGVEAAGEDRSRVLADREPLAIFDQRLLGLMLDLVDVADLEMRVADGALRLVGRAPPGEVVGDRDGVLIGLQRQLQFAAFAREHGERVAEADQGVVELLLEALIVRVRRDKGLRHGLGFLGQRKLLLLVLRVRLKVGFEIERVDPERIGGVGRLAASDLAQEVLGNRCEALCAFEVERSLVIGRQHVAQHGGRRIHRAAFDRLLLGAGLVDLEFDDQADERHDRDDDGGDGEDLVAPRPFPGGDIVVDQLFHGVEAAAVALAPGGRARQRIPPALGSERVLERRLLVVRRIAEERNEEAIALAVVPLLGHPADRRTAGRRVQGRRIAGEFLPAAQKGLMADVHAIVGREPLRARQRRHDKGTAGRAEPVEDGAEVGLRDAGLRNEFVE